MLGTLDAPRTAMIHTVPLARLLTATAASRITRHSLTWIARALVPFPRTRPAADTTARNRHYARVTWREDDPWDPATQPTRSALGPLQVTSDSDCWLGIPWALREPRKPRTSTTASSVP